MKSHNPVRRRLTVAGQVQGVGFRPFVYRLATAGVLEGFVSNDAGSVVIEVQGSRLAVARFVRRLRTELPPLASIASMTFAAVPILLAPSDGFVIAPSSEGEMADAQVTVDTVLCDDCRRELGDLENHRHGYPFINCTNCGPRYTIVKRVPYDRPNTTMAGFTMCPVCQAEYDNPADRRYHAQPIACATCGPTLWLTNAQGKEIICDDPIITAAEFLRRGKIVAIKGLGGFQLAVRADDDHAVRRLRQRKLRQAKPFALMVRDLEQAATLVTLDPQAQALLTSPQGPIVLLERLAKANVAESVAPGCHELGIMLPTTPIHHLLLNRDLPPLVMTSGNVTDEPLVKDNEDAIAHLGRVAEVLLLHNRPVERRLDDSVLMRDGTGRFVPLRRARGYAPAPVKLPRHASGAILAVGAELKNAFCFYRDGRAMLSEHIGDLKDGRTYRHFMQTISHLEGLYDFHPELLVADLHPGYMSTQYAQRRSKGYLTGRPTCPLVQVQHHHAHIAAVMAEHGREAPVIGIAADGTGYGPDGAVWGCEILRADLAGYTRLGHLRYFGLPGGDLAASETFRPGMSVLLESFGEQWSGLGLVNRVRIEPGRLQAITEMLRTGSNCPPSSSLGRLFDAAASIGSVVSTNAYEGQAAIMLESIARRDVESAYGFELLGDGNFQIDFRPMIRQMVADLRRREDLGTVLARFHNTIGDFLAAGARRASELTGITTVALSGGCFANRLLSARLIRRLTESKLDVLVHQRVPCNDGGLAIGQAVVAAYRGAVGMLPAPSSGQADAGLLPPSSSVAENRKEQE